MSRWIACRCARVVHWIAASSMVLACSFVHADSAEPSEKTEAKPSPLVRIVAPLAMDAARKQCKQLVERLGITPVTVDSLPEPTRSHIEAIFPERVLAEARIYFGVPLNDPSTGIGKLNALGLIASRGGRVLGMAFDENVYLLYGTESLGQGPAAAGILAHELMHIAQYQALGYEEYKRRYVMDAALRGFSVDIERDAYSLQGLYPRRPPQGFFGFMPIDEKRPRAVLFGDGRLVRARLSDLEGVTQTAVEFTADFEALPRKGVLIIPNEHGDHLPVCQLVDAHEPEPLHEFRKAGESTRLVFNGHVVGYGPWLIAVAGANGLEIIWRANGGLIQQFLEGDCSIDGEEDFGGPRISQQTSRGAVSWFWSGSGFVVDPDGAR